MLDAAIHLLAEQGYNGFSLADVGKTAGFSSGLAAHYFGRKDDLLAQAVRSTLDRYASSLAMLPPIEPGLERLAARIRHHARICGTPGSRALNLLLAEASLRPELKKVIDELTQQGMDRIRGELEDGIAAARIKAGIDVGTWAKMVFAFLRGQMAFSISEQDYNPHEVAEAFIAALSCALRPTASNEAGLADRSNETGTPSIR